MPPSVRTRISLFRPVIREDAIDAVAEVLRSGWLGTGPRTREFEDAFSSYVDAGLRGHEFGRGRAADRRPCSTAAGLGGRHHGAHVVASNQVIVQEGLAGVRRHRSDDGKRRFRFRRRVSDRPHRGSASRSLRRIPRATS